MLVGYMRVSSESDRQITDLQRDALLAAGVDGCQTQSYLRIGQRYLRMTQNPL
jgi:DNA invertase Pin-like site-specific DNA recombinase